MKDQLDFMTQSVTSGKMTRREFMGKTAALGISAAVAGSMFARAAEAAGPVKGGTLKLGSIGGGSTDSLDPAVAASQVPYHNLYQFGETLVNVTPEGGIENRVAESVEASADAKTWTFKIRKGVEFHNGKSVTAEDVMRTMERHSNDDSQSGALGIMRGIESMKADGDNFIVELTTPNADLPYLMADYHLMIQPDGGFDNPAAGIGSGAYMLEADEPGVRHMWKKNPNYWDDTRGHVDEVEIVVINDATARMAALQSGQVHIANRVEPKVAGLLDRAPNLTVRNAAGPGHYVFIMHCDTAPFDNNELRLALKYAINRDEMVDKVLRGYGSVGNDMPVNAAYPLFDDSIPQRPFDPAKAAEHYKKSGHDGSPITLRVSDVAFPGALDAAQLFQQSANAAGIPLELKREPGDGYWSEVWNAQPFCASYWGGRPVQDQMYSTAYLSTADWNDTRFKREDFDKLLFAARGELDEAKRKALYSQMGMMVRDEGGLICPMFNDFIEATSSKVQGWVVDSTGDTMAGKWSHKCWLA
ncbi:ABC transporter substrate-binding protein [Phaeobacter gallaeciensis]|uniref:Glutathione-binding protein GsiB n=1 Tax=Phaeobacter gallaeciensis TaxID=60890 RepID=A0AAC9Z855_9RHOB|nr:ABC transporter substrate-binding protein [Phaeobacter gallaeciensis]AHD08957.1 ABC-type dipeptide transport system, periplasmic component [Phaeobacter gallaeciensis DSM 26640]ATE92223.1 putative glutathione-binding protein GsiB [Phaeobacter gallaeciensis]ATE97958.1 putative glutathione-binding protein GsiB [Phaeobacter gallaeciensis]ATF00885.1 putative glutathione-binding protein GsiB [Phaeobacter gallaeciensis]ATF05265.1 putative glutathione-binding protein GsiB [Phaeobacter gallaeciensis